MSASTTLPSLEQNPSFQLGDIVTNISCELAQAAQGVQFVRGGEGWTATMDLSATLQNTGSVEANAGLDIPLTPGTASPNVKLGATGSAARVMTIGYEMDISKPESIPCNENSIGERAQLTSNLGLAEWLLAVQRTIDEQRSLQASFAPNKVATTITFTVTHSGITELRWELRELRWNYELR